MATVINNPSAEQTENSWVGMIATVLILGAFLALFLFYGLPMIRGSNNNATTADTGSTIEVPVPAEINVNTP